VTATTAETGKTRTTTDGGTVALSIIQYYSLSKSEKPDMLVGDVELRSDCGDCPTEQQIAKHSRVADAKAWLASGCARE